MCMLNTLVSLAKIAEPTECRLGCGIEHGGSYNHILDGTARMLTAKGTLGDLSDMPGHARGRYTQHRPNERYSQGAARCGLSLPLLQ